MGKIEDKSKDDQVKGHDGSSKTTKATDSCSQLLENTLPNPDEQEPNKENPSCDYSLTACKISITAEQQSLSEETASLIQQSSTHQESSSSISAVDEGHITTTSTGENDGEAADEETDEDDSIMRRNIDSLHQSISNMREEILER